MTPAFFFGHGRDSRDADVRGTLSVPAVPLSRPHSSLGTVIIYLFISRSSSGSSAVAAPRPGQPGHRRARHVECPGCPGVPAPFLPGNRDYLFIYFAPAVGLVAPI